MSDYPKFLPKVDADGKETDEGGIVVPDADAEAAAIATGRHVVRGTAKPPKAPKPPKA